MAPDGSHVFEFTVDGVAESSGAMQRRGIPDATASSRRGWLGKRSIDITDSTLHSFIETRVAPLADIFTASAEETARGFEVDSIELSIGVGAEGGLSFVAKASADAHIAVTLRRKAVASSA
jgi:Trypsin-co-occurring domain 1